MIEEIAMMPIKASGKIFSEIGDVLAQKFGNQWTKVRWKFAEDQYRQKIRTDLSHTRLLGAADNIDIEALFTDVNFFPEATATRRFKTNPERFDQIDELLSRRAADRIPAMELVKKYDRVYIVGAPGSGKTTFLQHIAILAAKEEIEAIPIFVSLKDWADSELDFRSFVVREFDICGFADAQPVIDQLLESGRAILLFDGLDEVSYSTKIRDHQIQIITNLARKYSATKIYITCRTSANDHSFSHFKYFEMADFSPAQQVEFVSKWYRQAADKLRLFLEEFQGPNSTSLRDLGRKPLFLAFLCIAFDQTLSFPRTKAELHAEAIDVLLNRWDSSRSVKRDFYGLRGTPRKKQFLAQLALKTFHLDQYVYDALILEAVLIKFISMLPVNDRPTDLEGDRLARSFEATHGILIERSVGHFSFAHLSIHEYFAAMALVDQKASGQPWSAVLPTDVVLDRRWREVVIHVPTLIQDADEYLRHVNSSIATLLATSGAVISFIRCICNIADNIEKFSEFSNSSIKYLNNSFYMHTSCEDYYPSQRLSGAVHRIEQSLLYSLRKAREQSNKSNAELTQAWKRVEVLRETLAYKRGVGLLIGHVADLDTFDLHLASFVDSQETYLVLLDGAMTKFRQQSIARILGSAWA
jgi:energy-coupling factor transporter ATP-binding protein EcfA2